MTIGIDPLVDFAAKRVLDSPEQSRITLHFLNLVLAYQKWVPEALKNGKSTQDSSWRAESKEERSWSCLLVALLESLATWHVADPNPLPPTAVVVFFR